MAASPVSSAVAACFAVYRRCFNVAHPPADADQQMARLAGDLARLSPHEQDDYYRLVRQLRMLVHLESQRVEWP